MTSLPSRLRLQHLYRACLAVGLPLVICSGAAYADDVTLTEGPVVIDQPRRPSESFHLDPGELSLTLAGVYQHETVTTGGVSSTTNQWLFSQQVSYSTHGYFLHPNFIELSLSLTGGVEEDYVNTETESSHAVDPIYSWDISATILRRGGWPVTLYSTRQQNWIFRNFGGVINSDSTSVGARLDHSEGALTTHMDVSHMTANQSGSSDTDNLSFTQDRFTWLSFYRPSANQTLNWSYNYANTNETGAVESSYATHDAVLSHEAKFGDKQLSTLNSTLSYSQQTGNTDIQRFRWDERLTLRHSDSFRTRYEFIADRTDISSSQRTNYRGTAGFTHYLFKSLTTNGNIGAQRTDDSEGGGATETFANINWEYRKAIPYGELTANLGLSWSQDNNDASGTVTTTRQSETFNTSGLIVLTGSNIDATSIVIRDPSGLLLRQGTDYTVRKFSDHVEIQRIIGGSISDGQTVLFDNTSESQPSNTVTSTSFSTGLRYDFMKGDLKGLALYARYSQQDQSISSESESTFTPNSFQDTVYGSEYRYRGLTVGAEQQLHDSTVYPYDATRVWGRYLLKDGDSTYSLN